MDFQWQKPKFKRKFIRTFRTRIEASVRAKMKLQTKRNDTEETICNTAHRDFLLQANKDFHICINYENYLIYGLVMRKICKCQIG